jgi:hypothetical protein
VGEAATYMFDFGDKWFSTLRALRTACAEEEEEEEEQCAGGLPLLGVIPASAPPVRYDGDPPTPWQYYLGLDLVDVPER